MRASAVSLSFAAAVAFAMPARASDSHGAVVIAVGDDAAPAAKALARELYRDDALRPAIDEALAKVYAGDAPAADAPQKVKDAAELRASIVKADSDAVARRLLSSLASDVHAEIAVEVVVADGHPTAHVLRVATSAFENVTIGGTVTTTPNGPSISWPGATESLRGFMTVAPKPIVVEPPPPSPKPAALKPVKQESPSPIKAPSFAWTSPWFWGTLGVLVAGTVSVVVFAKSSSSSSGDVHVMGTVPR